MARGATAEMETVTVSPDPETSSNGAAPTTDKPKAERKSNTVPVSIPKELYATLVERASEGLTDGQKPNVAGYLRKLVADAHGFVLPTVAAKPRRKYESKEAAIQARKDRYAKMVELYEAFERGEIKV